MNELHDFSILRPHRSRDRSLCSTVVVYCRYLQALRNLYDHRREWIEVFFPTRAWIFLDLILSLSWSHDYLKDMYLYDPAEAVNRDIITWFEVLHLMLHVTWTSSNCQWNPFWSSDDSGLIYFYSMRTESFSVRNFDSHAVWASFLLSKIALVRIWSIRWKKRTCSDLSSFFLRVRRRFWLVMILSGELYSTTLCMKSTIVSYYTFVCHRSP